jgi:hypothetical protein
MFVIARGTGIIGSQKSGFAIAIPHPAQIGRTSQNVVTRVERSSPRPSDVRRLAHVPGITCMSPIAPADDTACASPLLSACSTAAIHEAESARGVAASAIMSA